jgi:hypothetical protein
VVLAFLVATFQQRHVLISSFQFPELADLLGADQFLNRHKVDFDLWKDAAQRLEDVAKAGNWSFDGIVQPKKNNVQIRKANLACILGIEARGE